MRPTIAIVAAMALAAGGSQATLAHAASAPKGRAVMDTARVHVGPVDAGTEAFVAWPAKKGTGPAVIVVHEWWGLNPQIREVARKLASQGYVAIVPDLYHGNAATDAEQAHVLARGLESARVNADLDGAVAWLRAEPRVGKSRIGVIGFCMGGSRTLEFALHSPELAAAVTYYGLSEIDPEQLARLATPLQGHFGDQDDGIPVTRVQAFQQELEKQKKPAEIYVYAGAGHAFMNDTRASYHADAARQAWTRTLAFLQKYLKG